MLLLACQAALHKDWIRIFLTRLASELADENGGGFRVLLTCSPIEDFLGAKTLPSKVFMASGIHHGLEKVQFLVCQKRHDFCSSIPCSIFFMTSLDLTGHSRSMLVDLKDELCVCWEA